MLLHPEEVPAADGHYAGELQYHEHGQQLSVPGFGEVGVLLNHISYLCSALLTELLLMLVFELGQEKIKQLNPDSVHELEPNERAAGRVEQL